MIPLPLWLVVPPALYVGKKLYDAVKDSGTSSAGSQAHAHDEHAEYEARARQQREENIDRQLNQTLRSELLSLCARYVAAPTVPGHIPRERVAAFFGIAVKDLASATAALSQLLGKPVSLKAQPVARAEYAEQLKDLDRLEQLIRNL